MEDYINLISTVGAICSIVGINILNIFKFSKIIKKRERVIIAPKTCLSKFVNGVVCYFILAIIIIMHYFTVVIILTMAIQLQMFSGYEIMLRNLMVYDNPGFNVYRIVMAVFSCNSVFLIVPVSLYYGAKKGALLGAFSAGHMFGPLNAIIVILLIEKQFPAKDFSQMMLALALSLSLAAVLFVLLHVFFAGLINDNER